MRHHQANNAPKALVLHLLPCSAAMLAVLILACSASAAEWRAFWVDTWGAGILSQSEVDTLLGVPGTSTKGQIRDANCNAVFIEVRRNCDACYPSSMDEPYMSGLSPANFNALQACINAAHDTTGGKKRIEVHCWIVTFRTSGGTVYSRHSDPPTGSLTTLDNYWPSRDDAGAEVSDKAFDPGHPLALQYTVNVAMDLVNNFDIDGIHYDYIRFTAKNQGYNPTSIARYNARYGLTGQPSPDDPQFMQWRRDQVTALVRQVYARIQKSKPWVKQSGSFVTWNPSPTASTREAFEATRPYGAVYDQDGVYSDWDSWVQEGIVDMAVPMTYYDWASLPNDYTRWMNFEKDRKGKRHMIIGPGIYLNYLSDAILELQMTRDPSPAGNYADGFCGYSYRSPYSTAKSPTRTYGTWSGFRPSLVSQVTPTWADIPDMPWKTAPAEGHMMGTVTVTGTGAWADGATVSITGPTNRSLYLDGTGFYAFIDIPPGSYTTTASKPGYPNATATVNVAIGQVTGNMYQQDFVLGANTPPLITTQPESQSLSLGANATFTVTATGTAPLYYQWRLYATNIPGANASSYTRNNVQAADAGPYSVFITNTVGSVTSSNAILTVITNITPPAIAAQPQSQTIIVGQSATFTVTATGTAPLSYQWRFNGTPIGGATDTAYTRANVQTAHAGSYSVVVTNAAGSTNSADAVLTVNCTLTATAGNGGTVSQNPDQASYAANSVVTLTATANTGYAFTGWSGDATGTDNPLPVTMNTNKTITANFGSTTPEIVIDNTDPGWSNTSPGGASWSTGSLADVPKIGSNYLYTSGTGDSSITRSCRWTPQIGTAGLYDVYAFYQIGANRTAGATYHVFYDGGSLTSLQNQHSDTPNQGGWFLIGTNLPFATTGGYVELGNNTPDSYSVSADAAKFVLVTPFTAPSITVQPQDEAVVTGQSASFSVTATGTAPLGYQWRRNGANIADANASSYTLNEAQPADAGSYSVLVTNMMGSATSSNALLTVNVPPAITTHPHDLTVNQGSDATFTVVATGTAPLDYQWYFRGLPIADATDSQFTVTNTQPEDAGEYSVEVLNVAGQGTSSNATLAVNLPPEITAHPQSLSVTVGSNATFSVAVAGTAPLSYQWRFNGTNLAHATDSAYTCWNAQTNNAGAYSVVVSNMAGTATSDDAMLTVTQPAQPQIDEITMTSGGQIQLQISAVPGCYAIEGASNLFDWADLEVVTNTGASFQYTDSETNLTQRFYRIRLVP